MTVELAELAAGLPMALSFALAGGLTSLREARRRAALNEAIHELRRPLQILSLTLPVEHSAEGAAGSSLRLAATALDRLDREINGTPRSGPEVIVEIGCLLEEAVVRWRHRATTAGRRLELRLDVTGIDVYGVRSELEQAVDNLINNAFEHGGGQVTVEACRDSEALLVRVRDDGAPPPPIRRPRRQGSRGHGLRVVSRIAVDHGGSFELRRSSLGTEACLWLPLWDGGRQRDRRRRLGRGAALRSRGRRCRRIR
jgi:signal transduction histidine kinase